MIYRCKLQMSAPPAPTQQRAAVLAAAPKNPEDLPGLSVRATVGPL